MATVFMETADTEVSPGFLATTTHGLPRYAGQRVRCVDVADILVEESPFSIQSDGLQISSREMEIGRPYSLLIGDWWFVVVRRRDDHLYFYHMSE